MADRCSGLDSTHRAPACRPALHHRRACRRRRQGVMPPAIVSPLNCAEYGASGALDLAAPARIAASEGAEIRGSFTMAKMRVVALYRYPVKGFSPEPLERAEIAKGGNLPFDRAYRDRERAERLRSGGARLLSQSALPDADEERAHGRVFDALRRRDRRVQNFSATCAGRGLAADAEGRASGSKRGSPRISATSCGPAENSVGAESHSFSDMKREGAAPREPGERAGAAG